MAEILLTVAGQIYGGWKSARVTRALDAVAAAFELELVDRWLPEGGMPAIAPGARCTLALDSETVVTGYLDAVKASLESGAFGLTVSGRDLAADLVDCSAVHSPGEWTGISLPDLAGRLARPFGLSVASDVPAGAAFAFQIQPGESAYEALERACRKRGVLVVSDPSGGLRLASVATGRAATALREGVNVLSAAVSVDASARFSEYQVRAQQPSNDLGSIEGAAAVSARATDAGVSRYRPLVIVAESRASVADARTRAQWEAAMRAARATSLDVAVAGWRQGDGSLWQVNSLAQVELPSLRVIGEYLVVRVEYGLDDVGSTARLRLSRPDAFLPKPEAPKASEDWESSL